MTAQPTIYLLDDELELVDLLGEYARMIGYQVVGFGRAEEMFAQVAAFERTSLLVLDLHMPGLDGIEVMRRLAKAENPPALLLISGHDQSVLRSAEKLGRAQGLKITGSLTKPLNLETFQQELRQFKLGVAPSTHSGTPSFGRSPLANELSRAIHQGELVLHYQPQVRIADGHLTGVEALLRWQHPDLGLIYPEQFVPTAEEGRLIDDLTHWVISEVVAQEQRWLKQGASLAVSINISAANVTSLTLPEQISRLLVEHRLDPGKLTLELTETALMEELVTSLDILTRLRLKGIALSIDDFGTGYSSLSQLHRIPFNELKVDRSFVSDMVADEEARAIVKTCIVLGHELNMRVVAEGVESQEIWWLLAEMGCDIAQGFQISRALPGDQLIDWAESRNWQFAPRKGPE